MDIQQQPFPPGVVPPGGTVPSGGTVPPVDDSNLLGGRYLLGERVGSGGMADVYAGRDLRLDRPVAVKVLRAALAADPVQRVRFGREARAAASLNHPGIVAVFDSGEGAGRTMDLPYLVMEYLPGRTLAQILDDDGPLPPYAALGATAALLDALAHAHAHGMIHRDVKPANAMVLPDGSVKLMDFGIARSAHPTGGPSSDAAQLTLTAAGMVVGTADYLSPEQARGEPLDARSDLYAVGCMLHELLTGRPPLTAATPLDTVWRRLREDAPPPSTLIPGLSPDVDALVCRSLARNPSDRFPDALSMRAAVQAALDEEHASEGDDGTRLLWGSPDAQGLPDIPAAQAQSPDSATVRLSMPTAGSTTAFASASASASASALSTTVLRREATVVEPLPASGTPDTSGGGSDDSSDPDRRSPAAAQPQRRRRRGAWAGLAVALAAGAVGGWFALGGGADAASSGTAGGGAGTSAGTSVASTASVTVPDLAHDSLSHARRTLLGLGLHVGHISVGDCTGSEAAPRTVCAETPAPGSALRHGASVSLSVSRAPALAGGTGAA